MLNRLIRWLARNELAEIERTIAKQRIEIDVAIYQAYCNGFNAGRAIGQGEAISHLRGDPEERITSDMIAERATRMIN